MPVSVSYPGVYVEELSSGVHTITGVATSIAAFIGYTSRGLDNRAQLVLSFSDFERRYGGLDANSELSYAVQQFFNNGGNQAYIVRVPRNGATDASVTMFDALSGGNQALTLASLSAGTLANGLLIEIDYDGIDTSDANSYNITITDPTTGAVENFRVSQISTASNYVCAVINDEDNGSQFVSATVPNASAGRPAQNGTPGNDLTISSTAPITGPIAVTITCIAKSGTIVNAAAVNALNTGDSAGSILGLAGLVQRNLNQQLPSTLAGTAVTCVPSQDGKGLRILGNFNQSLLPDTSDVVITFGGADVAKLAVPSTGNVASYVLGADWNTAAQTASAGSDGTGLPKTAAIIGDSSAVPPTGIYALDKVDIFNLLCIPDATRAAAGDPNALDQGTNSKVDPVAIFGAALDYCQSRRAFLLVDPPPNINNVDKANDWVSDTLSGLSQSYGAAYFPRIRLQDPLNNYQLRTFAPCGVIAGLYSRIDGSRGVWKAPAGTEATLNHVQSMVYKLNDAENGVLNPLGLNCLRSFPIYGNICWGARTLRGSDVLADDYKYVPVRRLALYIESSLYQGTKWAVFEGNSDPLWAQLRLNIGAFMNTLFRQGAFAGTTAKSSYFVKCDSETTTQDDINQGTVNILVGFAPLKPAEFVIIQIQQMAGQIQT